MILVKEQPLMKCGHVANAIDANGNPICAICYGFTPDAKIIANKKPNLEGRKARCNECGKVTGSSYSLPFFRYRPNEDYDTYYCGCHGWG